jgi:hypothetical protein
VCAFHFHLVGLVIAGPAGVCCQAFVNTDAWSIALT